METKRKQFHVKFPEHLSEDERNRWPLDYEVGGRFFGVLPPLPMPEEQMAEALGAYGY